MVRFFERRLIVNDESQVANNTHMYYLATTALYDNVNYKKVEGALYTAIVYFIPMSILCQGWTAKCWATPSRRPIPTHSHVSTSAPVRAEHTHTRVSLHRATIAQTRPQPSSERTDTYFELKMVSLSLESCLWGVVCCAQITGSIRSMGQYNHVSSHCSASRKCAASGC
jgi:hypothetical protein